MEGFSLLKPTAAVHGRRVFLFESPPRLENLAFRKREAQDRSAMREIFASHDQARVGYYKSMLDEAGIPSFIRNESTGLPTMEGTMFVPVLCVTHDDDYAEAVEVIKSRQAPETPPRADWTCPSCSEVNPGNFEICWKCSTPRPSEK